MKSLMDLQVGDAAMLIQILGPVGRGLADHMSSFPPQRFPDGCITANGPGGLSPDYTKTVRSHFTICLMRRKSCLHNRNSCPRNLLQLLVSETLIPSLAGPKSDSGLQFRNSTSQRIDIRSRCTSAPSLTRLFHLPHIVARIHDSPQDTQHSRTEHQRHSGILQISLMAPPKQPLKHKP